MPGEPMPTILPACHKGIMESFIPLIRKPSLRCAMDPTAWAGVASWKISSLSNDDARIGSSMSEVELQSGLDSL